VTAPLLGSATDTPTIVTAFFDLGRENWAGAVAGQHIAPWMSSVEVPDFFARSNQLYLDRFASLAPLKNPMVIFTEDRFCQFVHDARRAHGLLDQTRIVACKSPFRTSTPLDHAIERTRKAIARPEYGSFVARPYCPEHWNPHYVVMTMFKFTLVNTAIEMGLIDTPSLAWIDFGYCRDQDRFDKTRPWSFACGDKIHIFHIEEPDDRPIFDVVRSGAVYFMACHILSPTARWAEYLPLIEDAFRALLDCGLPDDEQTAMLMAYRRMPSLFCTHAVDPSDWFVIFKQSWT
jgi:protein YibB